ncbi:MAG: cytochrome c [bacterium]
MANIRARFHLRVWFLLLGLGLTAATFFVFRSDERQIWKRYQREYREAHRQKLLEKRAEAAASRDETDLKKWSHLIEEAKDGDGQGIRQIYLPEAGIHDLCQTCHQAMENPLFQFAANPLTNHPVEILKQHKPGRFGCTLCHHGQGVGLTPRKAHGDEPNWPQPRVPRRYMQALCLGCHETPFQLAGAEKAEQGRRLFLDNGCYGCHDARALSGLPSKAHPLDGAGLKLESEAWLAQWIRDPPGIRPGTTMPSFRLEEQELRDLIAFVSARKELPQPLPPYAAEAASADIGKELFTKKGCIGCHGVERGDATASRLVPNLADAGLKLSGAWIRAWLEEPSAMNPETPMPKLTLTAEERRDLTAYLKSQQNPEVAALLAAAGAAASSGGGKGGQGDAEQGARVVQIMGCYGCHKLRGTEGLARPGLEVAEVAKKRLEELPFGNSTVAQTKWDWLSNKIRQPAVYQTEDMRLKMPDYRLADDEVESLTIFYLQNRAYDLPDGMLYRDPDRTGILARGQWLIDRHNCGACHQLDEGLLPRIDRFFELKSLVPPRLVGEGERVQPQWFFQYLSRPVVLRPWLEIRMPQFDWTYEERKGLVAYFTERLPAESRPAAAVPYVLLPVREDVSDESVAMGEYRVRTDKCVQCHPISLDGQLPEGIKLEDLSINLMLSKGRLRYEWIKNFLRNPDRYAGAGTKMPFVYYTPDGVPRIPEPEKWIEYSALYLMFMEQAPEAPKEDKIEDIRPGTDVDWTQY